MNTHAQVAPAALTISDISIRQDNDGRFNLNDLHKAAGNQNKHRPKYWLQNQQTIELIEEISKGGIPPLEQNQALKVIHGGNNQGTYVVKELVYSYAMWISAAFSLKVIRAYDALVTTPKSTDTELSETFITFAEFENRYEYLSNALESLKTVPVIISSQKALDLLHPVIKKSVIKRRNSLAYKKLNLRKKQPIPFSKDYVLLNIVQFYSGKVVERLVPQSLLSKGAIDTEHLIPVKRIEELSLNTHAQDDFEMSTARKDNTYLPELVDELGNILNAYESLHILATESYADAFYCNSILLPLNNQLRALFKRFDDKILN